MARTQLTQTQKQLRAFSVWVGGMLATTDNTQEDLARYLGIDRSGVSMKIHGKTPWSLKEYFMIQEFFEEEYKA